MNFLNFQSFEKVLAIVQKDFLIGLRQRAAFASMMMFALTAIASLSLSMRGISTDTNFLAALLWVVIFFASSSGIAGTFDDEANSGTLQTLKIYAAPQIILFGKMIFSFLSLVALIIFLLPTFLILFDVAVEKIFLLCVTIFVGVIGISAAGTLTAALTTSATVKGGLFPILLFPILLPIFLPAIQLTNSTLTGENFSTEFLFAIIIYDAILITATSILYDYLE